MRLSDIKTAETTQRDAEVAAPSRALVAFAPVSGPRMTPIHRPAPFLAQLLASKAQLPQTRERRRAGPDEAAHLYEAALTATPYVAGRHFSRDS